MSKGNSREKAGQLKEDCPPAPNLCFGDKTKVKEEGILLNMSQIDDIRERARKGYRLAEICRATGHDPKTVRKYLEMDDFSPRPPAKKVFPSKLDPYKATIDQWLADDGGTWRKQWHTAQRIHDRLAEEVPGYDCSYSTVQRYVKERRRAAGERAFLELTWHPGESQADFGEADFCERGITGRRKYLTLSFPYSNNGFSQVFGGETAECVCQGLKDVFAYIGGVPPVIVFDNASGVGRRVGEVIIESDLFRRFRCHYGFMVRFCNPDSGHEKGNVERKVAFTRRNLFVPVPAYEDVLAYNRKLLDRHREKAAELHYRKGVPIGELFRADRAALLPLPPRSFDVCRYERQTADGYGKVTLDSKHRYSTCPEFAKQEVVLGVRAHTVDVLDAEGRPLVTHRRSFAERRTDTLDHRTSLAQLLRNPGAWRNSGIRESAPEALRAELDRRDRAGLRQCLKLMAGLASDFGFEVALAAMEEAAGRGHLNAPDATVLAARIAGFGLSADPEPGPDLSAYDRAFLIPEEVLT
jgi:transposase